MLSKNYAFLGLFLSAMTINTAKADRGWASANTQEITCGQITILLYDGNRVGDEAVDIYYFSPYYGGKYAFQQDQNRGPVSIVSRMVNGQVNRKISEIRFDKIQDAYGNATYPTAHYEVTGLMGDLNNRFSGLSPYIDVYTIENGSNKVYQTQHIACSVRPYGNPVSLPQPPRNFPFPR